MNPHRITIAVMAASLLGCDANPVSQEQSPHSKSIRSEISVTLEIDFQGVQPNVDIETALADQSTVVELMEKCQSEGQIEFERRGSGETAFVHKINGVANQLADGSNWLFWVDGKMADRGAGVVRLNDGDAVVWKFSAEYLE